MDGYKGNTCEQYTGMLLQKNVDKKNRYYDLHVTYGLYWSDLSLLISNHDTREWGNDILREGGGSNLYNVIYRETKRS